MTPDVRTDRDAIRAAAAAIRSTAIQDQYAGTRGHPAAAFSMAAVLDELALHAASLPDTAATSGSSTEGAGWRPAPSRVGSRRGRPYRARAAIADPGREGAA